MSKRSHGTAGAFDAFVRALVGLGTTPSWTALPPATVPGSLPRALGQGVLQGRLPREAQGPCTGDTAPQPVEALRHEGQRSVVELGTILWHAMAGARDAPELAPWMTRPQTDPIVALTLSRQRLGEYAVREPLDRSFALPGDRVWLVEIERARGDTPAAVAVWRSPGPDGEWRTRCACLWTHGRIGTPEHPLVIGAQWDERTNEATAGACVLGPSWDQATRAASDGAREATLARRQSLIGKEVMAQIAMPAALAWLDAHAGTARPAGRVGAETGSGTRIVAPVPGAQRTPPPAWLDARAEWAVEALVIGTAREGFRIGASCPVEAWRHGWAGYAEMAAVAWYAIADQRAQIDADRWAAMEKALRDGALEERCAHPALAATSALVRKMVVQTGRSHVARASDARTLCALEVPARLWRALGEAGPCPGGTLEPDLAERWWLVEIEAPAEDEPNAVALWEADGAEVTLAAFLCPGERGEPPFVTVVTWCTGPEGARNGAGLAALRAPPVADDPASPESRAGLEQVVEALAAPETGAVARTKAAIMVHLEADGQAAPLGAYRPSAGGAALRCETPRTGQRSPTALFAIERAPEPERDDSHGAGGGQGPRAGARLEERQRVRAHWKRQAYGPRHSKRRRRIIESYKRGPKPGEDQILMTRLAEGRSPGHVAHTAPEEGGQ